MSNAEVYQVALNGVPYVAAAYGLIWLTLFVYIGLVFRRLLKVEKELAVVEESVVRRTADLRKVDKELAEVEESVARRTAE